MEVSYVTLRRYAGFDLDEIILKLNVQCLMKAEIEQYLFTLV